jgi:hypothetical protein
MTRREFFPLLAAPLLAQTQGEVAVRSVVIVRDISPSYKNSPPVAAKLSEIVHELGPGDVLTIIELGGRFSPEGCVKVQCAMPRVTAGVLSPVKRLDDWRKNQLRLDAVWRRVEANQRAIESYVRTPPPVKDPTPLFEALAYASSIMKTAGGTRTLLVFSDLIQDSGGVSSPFPPKELMGFPGVSGYALFVPWNREFSERAAAWRRWFIASGATGFEMLDGAQSQVRQVLGKNAAPRVLPQRF